MNDPRRGAVGRGLGLGLCLVVLSCGDSAPPAGSGSGTTSGTPTRAPTGASSGPGSSSSPDPATSTGPASSTGASSSSSGGADETGTTTGSTDCAKNVVLMGYWPPTNEMLRPFSRDPAQNPGAWVGQDWEGHGYDVYAFFPEFPPDGDPSNDDIGDDGAVGSPRFDLRVDYQATSADFWRLVDTYQPLVLVTTSRGGSIGWEIEALEGGHGGGGPNPAFDWSSDQHGAETHPTQASIEARSWDAISMYRQGDTLPSQLPVDAIFEATEALGVASVEIDLGTSGNFLSGFLGLHGLYYDQLAPHCVAAGHIHVANGLPVATAEVLLQQTLRTILEQYPAEGVGCSPPGA